MTNEFITPPISKAEKAFWLAVNCLAALLVLAVFMLLATGYLLSSRSGEPSRLHRIQEGTNAILSDQEHQSRSGLLEEGP